MRLRFFMATAGGTLLVLAALQSIGTAAKNPSESGWLVYFGTYTGPKSKGIYVSRFDSATGKLEPARLAAEIVRPSWITIHPNHRFLYSVSELGNKAGEEAGITSFSIDPASGDLKQLNKVSSGGGGACHLAIDKAGKAIYVANYNTGSAAAVRLQPDGQLGDRLSLMQHQGSSVDKKRQNGPHAHAVVLSADNRFLFVPDLGLDQVKSYKVGSDGSLSPNDPPGTVKPGSGPRHFAIHPSNKFAYGLNEMGSSVTGFNYAAAKGSLNAMETVSTLPPNFSGEDNSAEVQIDRAGKFLYASNRGDDSIAVFAIDKSKGNLTSVQHVPTQGKTPRSFSLDPSGRYLLAANQDTNSVVVFQVDGKTGKLTPTGQTIEVGAPVCIQFLPAGGK